MNKFFEDCVDQEPTKQKPIKEPAPPTEKRKVQKLTSKRSKKNYVNNIDMFNAMVEWKEELETNSQAPLPNYIGECFMKMTESLGRKTHAHTHLDDMKSHALLTCCLYAKNFNPEKSTNPFAYFTSFINNAFAQIHNREKEEIEGKFEMIKEKTAAHDNYDYRERKKETEEWDSTP